MKDFIFTSESVSEGHPDKVADQISDAIVDKILEQDPKGRIACETMVSTGLVMLAGEITTHADIDYQQIVRNTIEAIGYNDSKIGFDYKTCCVENGIIKQSKDIALGVDKGGAGDQGIMFGFAIDETEELMPLPIVLAHKLVKKLSDVRKAGELSYLRPDSKSQVTVEYKNNKPVSIDSIVISSQHTEDVSNEELKAGIIDKVINPVIKDDIKHDDLKIYINPTGRFVIGGPHGDCGLTGRKIIVDTYGGYSRHGGGAFSGKDPSKVDRSASYMARYVAKNLVKAGLCNCCEVQFGYVIGVSEPVSVYVNTFGTGKKSEDAIAKIINKYFDLRPLSIIDKLDLRKPRYLKTASYGHFGRLESNFTWEDTKISEELQKEL